MQIYTHRQIGKLMLSVLGFGVLAIFFLWIIIPSGSVVKGLVLITLLTCLLLFWSLTAEVTNERVTVSFGPGLIRKVFQTNEILDVRIVRNRWYYGWGIRRIPHGWLFNVSGFDAVELQLKNKRRFRIGTDEPEQLLAAIHQALHHNG